MPFMIPLALFGWIPLVLALFLILRPRRAVFISMVAGWMFLPGVSYSVSGLPNYGKAAAICYAALLGILLFDTGRLTTFRLSWFDLPMIVWCVCPFASSISNDLGAYDGLSAILGQIVVWGLPYFLGRLYITNLDALRELTRYVFIGGLIYVPLCIIELRMSPQLHYWVYGVHTNIFLHNVRWGGYRPTVFMRSGLMVGLWMAAASLCGLWPKITGAFRRMWAYDLWWFLAPLLVITVLCKALGALILLVAALGAMLCSRWTRLRTPLICLILIAPTYSFIRATSLWNGESAVTITRTLVNDKRAQSLETRIDNENRLIGKAMEQPVFGWGRWGRSRVYNKHGKDITITDGLWVIALGRSGLVGLLSLTAVFLVPTGLMIWRFGPDLCQLPQLAPVAVWTVVEAMFSIDNQLNAMEHPVFLLAMGGLIAIGARRISPTRAHPRAVTQTTQLPTQARRPT